MGSGIAMRGFTPLVYRVAATKLASYVQRDELWLWGIRVPSFSFAEGAAIDGVILRTYGFGAARRPAVLAPGGGERPAKLRIAGKEAGTLGDIIHLARPKPEAATPIRSDIPVLLDITSEQRAPACQNFCGDPILGVFTVTNHNVGRSQSSVLHGRRQDANPWH